MDFLRAVLVLLNMLQVRVPDDKAMLYDGAYDFVALGLYTSGAAPRIPLDESPSVGFLSSSCDMP